MPGNGYPLFDWPLYIECEGVIDVYLNFIPIDVTFAYRYNIPVLSHLYFSCNTEQRLRVLVQPSYSYHYNARDTVLR